LYRRTKTVKDAGKEIGATDSIRPSSLSSGTKKRVDESATKPVLLVPRNDVEVGNDDPSERSSLRNPEKRPTMVAKRDMMWMRLEDK
jgi:hypothetical protein